MTKAPDLPIQKTEEEIQFYLKYCPLFGEILLDLKAVMDEGTISIKELKDMFQQSIYNMFKDIPRRNIIFPFKNQINHLKEEFGESICISCNNTVAHGRTESINYGDIVSVDCGVAVRRRKGRLLHFDAAFTTFYGGFAEDTDYNWINIPQQALISILEGQPKNNHQLGGLIAKTAVDSELQVVASLTGHGIGHSLHESPIIHNMPGAYMPVSFFEGMVFCAEPIFVRPDDNPAKITIAETYLESDGWSVSTISGAPASHFETMLAIINGQIVDLIGVSRWEL